MRMVVPSGRSLNKTKPWLCRASIIWRAVGAIKPRHLAFITALQLNVALVRAPVTGLERVSVRLGIVFFGFRLVVQVRRIKPSVVGAHGRATKARRCVRSVWAS